MAELSQHHVVKIELVYAYTANSGSRTVRITSKNPWSLAEDVTDITLYGATDALDALPKSPDFKNYNPPVAICPGIDEVA